MKNRQRNALAVSVDETGLECMLPDEHFNELERNFTEKPDNQVPFRSKNVKKNKLLIDGKELDGEARSQDIIQAAKGLGKFATLLDPNILNTALAKHFDLINGSDRNVIVAVPSDGEKVAVFDLAMIRLAQMKNVFNCFYVAGTRTLCKSRQEDWTARLFSVGITCSVLDNVNVGKAASDRHVSITTPECLDFYLLKSRNRLEFKKHSSLLILDEFHSMLGDSQGSKFEAVMTRILMVAPSIRIVGACTMISMNTSDFAKWLSTKEKPDTLIVNLQKDKRGASVEKAVYGYPTMNMNHFQFENSLTRQLDWIIGKHSPDRSPTIIFCSTRKSAELTATFLAKNCRALSSGNESDLLFLRKDLYKLVSLGVAYLHAGLAAEDREAVKTLFLNGQLPILCITGALATKMNLSANLVIFKGTKQYGAKGYEEYSNLDVEQMLERTKMSSAGTSGIAVILTSNETKSLYMSNSSLPVIESRIHHNIEEIILTEICLGTIFDQQSALEWMRKTFLFHRAVQRGGLEAAEDCISACINNRMINELEEKGLITKDDYGRWIPFPAVAAMSKMGLYSNTILSILKLPKNMSSESLFIHLCKSISKKDLWLNQGDKGSLQKLARSSKLKFSFPAKGITEAWHKAFIIVQVILSKDEEGLKLNYSQNRDSKTIMIFASKIIRGIIAVLKSRGNAAIALRDAIELEGAINGRVWHESKCSLRQIEGIGAGYALTLQQAGICSIKELFDIQPSKIELLLKRNPPFGLHIHQRVQTLPKLAIKAELFESAQKDQNKVGVLLCANATACDSCRFYLLVISKSANYTKLEYFHSTEGFMEMNMNLVLSNWSEIQQVTLSLMCSQYAGLNAHKVIQNEDYKDPIEPSRPLGKEAKKLTKHLLAIRSRGGNIDATRNDASSGIDNFETGSMSKTFVDKGPVESQQIRAHKGFQEKRHSMHALDSDDQDSRMAKGDVEISGKSHGQMIVACSHRCRDKEKCAHLCCKQGITHQTAKRAQKTKIHTESSKRAHAEAVSKAIKAFQFTTVHEDISSSSEGEEEVEYMVTDGNSRTDAFLKYIYNLSRIGDGRL